MIEKYKGGADLTNLKKPVRSLTGDAKWKDIVDLVNRWGRRNPEGMKMTMDYARELREDIKDKKYGFVDGPRKTGSGGTRVGLVIHPELINYIQAFYPDFLDSNEDVANFKKYIPNLRIPEK